MMALSHVRARVTLIVSHGGKAKVQGSGAEMRQKSWRESSGAEPKITQWVPGPPGTSDAKQPFIEGRCRLSAIATVRHVTTSLPIADLPPILAGPRQYRCR